MDFHGIWGTAERVDYGLLILEVLREMFWIPVSRNGAATVQLLGFV